MEKKLLPALILTLLAGTAMAMDDASKTDKSMSGASSASTTDSNSPGRTSGSSDRSMSGADAGSASSGSNQSGGSAASMGGGAGSVDASRLAELTADPKTTLFLRLDTDKNGYLSQQEIGAGKDLLTLDVSDADSTDQKGVDLIGFKTALTNSMLGMGGTTMASSSTGGSSGNTGSGSSASSGSGSNNASTSASTDSDRNVQGAGAEGTSGGMQSDKVMDEVQEEGGPTMLRGGPNPRPDQLTPEQKLNNPNAGEGMGTQ